MVERLGLAIRERLEELVPILCTVEYALDDQGVEAAASGGGLCSKLDKYAFVGISRKQAIDLEVFEVWAFQLELLQRPLL